MLRRGGGKRLIAVLGPKGQPASSRYHSRLPTLFALLTWDLFNILQLRHSWLFPNADNFIGPLIARMFIQSFDIDLVLICMLMYMKFEVKREVFQSSTLEGYFERQTLLLPKYLPKYLPKWYKILSFFLIFSNFVGVQSTIATDTLQIHPIATGILIGIPSHVYNRYIIYTSTTYNLVV